MIITSVANAEAVERRRGVTQYRLLAPDLHGGPGSPCGAAVEVSLLVLAAGTTQVLAADKSEQAFVVTCGTADVAGSPAPPAPSCTAPRGSRLSYAPTPRPLPCCTSAVQHCRPAGRRRPHPRHG